MRRALCILACVALWACGGEESSTQTSVASSVTLAGSGSARPFSVYTPSSYDGDPMPLIVLLHGLGGSGAGIEEYFGLQSLAQSHGFLYVHPDGSLNPQGHPSWNATDACCGFGSAVDDVTYLTSIIDSVSETRNVDAARIYVMGHSNGGFMSYRMACDAAHRVAAIASLAGATWADVSKCDPSEPVSVLQVHGTADVAIAYEGGEIPYAAAYPSATTSVATWAAYDGCRAESLTNAGTLDLDSSVAGAETVVTRVEGCPDGLGVELWTLQDGTHVPEMQFPDGTRPMAVAIVEWLLAHPKP